MSTFENASAIEIANDILHAAYRLTGREKPLYRDDGEGDIATVKDGIGEIATRFHDDNTLAGQDELRPIVEALGCVEYINDINGEVARALSTLQAPDLLAKPVPVNPFASGPKF